MSDNGKLTAEIVAEIQEAQSSNVAQHLEDLKKSIQFGLKMLARYRENNDEARENLIRLIQDLEATPEYQHWSQAKAQAEREMVQMERSVKADILAYLDASGEKPTIPATGTRKRTTLMYSDQLALAWCQLYFDKALALNRDLFEKHARAVAETNPVPFVEFRTETIATISQDLSMYLTPEGADSADGFPE